MIPRKFSIGISLILAWTTMGAVFAQSKNIIQTFEERLPEAKGDERGDILYILIGHYSGTDLSKAEALADQLVQLGREMEDRRWLVKGIGEKGNLLRRRSKRDSAQYMLFKAKRIALDVGDESTEGYIYARLGQFYDDFQTDSASYYLRKSAESFRMSGEMTSVAFALAYRSVIFRKAARMDSAKILIDSATIMIANVMKSDSSYKPTRQSASIASYAGGYYTSVGKYKEALSWNLKALRFFEMIGDVRSQAAVHHTTGTTYRMLLKFDRSIEQFRAGLRKFQSVGDRYGVEACFESLGLVFDDLEKFDSSEVNFNRALEIATALGRVSTQANVINNMGAMYYSAGDYSKAQAFYEKAFALRGGMKDANLDHRATAMINLGQVATKAGQFAKAANYLTLGLRLARDLRSPDYEKSAVEGLVDNFKALGDFRAAVAYQDSLIQLKDSLYVADSQAKVAEMEVQYNTEKKEQQILLLTTENKLAQLKQTAWMTAFAIVIVVAALALYTFQTRRARIKAELNLAQKESETIRSELAYKEREMVNLATYITEKNSFLESILETVDAIDVRKEDAQRELEKLAPLIRENINISGSRDEFNAFMTTVYGGFIRKLEEKYPDLTDYEKRLATLLRVNLSSKQIASVLNISPKSVDMSRYRLRKKMSLNVDQDMQEVLTNL